MVAVTLQRFLPKNSAEIANAMLGYGSTGIFVLFGALNVKR